MGKVSTVSNQRDIHTDVPMVVIPLDDGFQVYAADNPDEVHEVTGNIDNPYCSCRDSQWRKDGRCDHVKAVLKHFPEEETFCSSEENSYLPESPEEVSSQMEMLLRRSVSPDGKIDSLSVEFKMPGCDLHSEVLEDVAMAALDRQTAIVNAFLDTNAPLRNAGNGNGNGHHNERPKNGRVNAMLTDIGGMNTKWGFRYFINVNVGNQTYKLFGTRKQLGEHLTEAGYGNLASRISKGAVLDIPCIADLVPSDDGKYTNVSTIAPRNGNGRNGR